MIRFKQASSAGALLLALCLGACATNTPSATPTPTVVAATAASANTQAPAPGTSDTPLPTAVPPSETPGPAPTATPRPTPKAAPTLFATLPAPTAGTTALTGQVSWMVLADPEQIKSFQAVADAFHAQNPGITVNLIDAADNEDNYHAALGTSLAGGSPPDLVNLDYDATGQYAASGALAPLDRDVAQSALIHPGDFYDVAWRGFQWQSQQICLPISVSGLMVYYNQKLFDAARLPYPKAGWTWAEFLADAQALTQGTDQYGLSIEPEFNNLLPFIWQNGGDLLSPDRGQLHLDSPADMAAVQFFVDLQAKNHVAPDQTAAASQEGPDRFVAGGLGMLIDSRAAVPTLRVITSFQWDTAPLPQQQQAANILKADGLCLPAMAKSPDLGWKLAEFAASPAGQQLLSAAGRIVPSNIAVSTSPVFTASPGAAPANSQAWLDAIPTIRVVPQLAHWPDVEETANQELANAYYGHATAADAVQAIITKTKRFLAP